MELSNMRNLNSSTDILRKEEVSTQKSSYLVSAVLSLVIFQILSKLVFQKRRNREQDGKRTVGLEVIRGPKPFFISFIGNAFDFLPLSETLNKVLTWHKLYGPCIRAIGVKRTGLAVFSAEMAQSFLKSGELGHISKNGMPFYDIMKPFLGNGLVIAEGLHWQSRRKVVMRSLSFQTLRTFTKLLNKHSKRFVTSLEKLFEDNDVHQINVQINCSFLAIITEILTGIDMGDDEKNEVAEYHHDFQTWKKCLIARTEKPWCLLDPFWKWHPMYPVHNDTVASLNAFAIRRIEEYKLKKLNSAKINEDSQTASESDYNSDPEDDGQFRPVLDELFNAGISENEVLYELNTLIFGGHETAATTIHFFFLLMALYPQCQEICRKEVDKVFEDSQQEHNETFTVHALANLKYVERCILETMRIYPSGFAFMRQLKKSLNIDYEGKNVEVPAGTDIAIVPWVIHRSTEYYDEPEKFDPDRFLPEQCSKRHPYSYLPFSAGPRNCIGWKFGMNEMKTVAGYVLRNFEIGTIDRPNDVNLLPNITLTPQRDYNFIFKNRKI